jgi:hypothetical protein
MNIHYTAFGHALVWQAVLSLLYMIFRHSLGVLFLCKIFWQVVTLNDQNLIPFDKRTKSEQREITSKGGKASGEARRKRKDMKQKMKALLELPAADNDCKELEALGVSPEDMDNEMVLVKAMFIAAAAGDVKAFDRVREVLGKDVRHEELELRKRELKLKEEAAKAMENSEGVHIIDDV